MLPHINTPEPVSVAGYGLLLICSMGLLVIATVGLTAFQIRRRQHREHREGGDASQADRGQGLVDMAAGEQSDRASD